MFLRGRYRELFALDIPCNTVKCATALIKSSPNSYMQKQPQTIEKNMGASDYAKRCSSRVNLDLKGENLMNVAQIKDEIRKLNRTDKIEICRWIDREVTDDISRIGMARSIQIRQEFEQICKAITGPERRVHLDNRDQDSFDLADQASRRRARATAA